MKSERWMAGQPIGNQMTHALFRFTWHTAIRMFLNMVIGLLAVTQATVANEHDDQKSNWLHWRGPLGTGEVPNASPPVHWHFSPLGETAETGDHPNRNITWHVRIPGRGHSTPIIVGDRIYVTTAIPIGDPLPPKYSGRPGAHDNLPITHVHQFCVLCIDRKTGDLLWKKKVHEQLPHEGGHRSASLASASPTSDGNRIFAFFGSYGLYCLDLDGTILWQKQFGKMHSKHGHGEGSSPALSDRTLIINWDHEEQSFVAALDTSDGHEKWRVNRDEPTSWASPLIVPFQGTVQVIVPGTHRIRAYDIESGKVLWSCGGLSANVVATPVAGDGMVFAASSYDTRNLLAIDLAGARGDITDSRHVAWSRREGTPYVPSPLLYKGSLYFLRHYQGILSRVDAKTGEERVGPFRLGALRNVYSSPIAADDRIYVSDLDGVTMVFTHSDVPRVLSVNHIGEPISASLVAVDSELYIRGEHHLLRIEESSAEKLDKE